MKATAVFMAVVCLLLIAPMARGDKAEALAKIDSLIESGHLDEAKQLIDHLMAHNPGDPDLKRLNQKWLVRKGDLGVLSTDVDFAKPENRKALREACFLVVRATMGGNPEEWSALLFAGDPEQVKEILTERTRVGSAEDRQTAELLLDPPEAPEPTTEELIADVKRGPDSCREALTIATRRKEKALRPFAKQIFGAKTTMDLRIAAAGLLLALGDAGQRDFLVEALEADRPIDAVNAARLLARQCGPTLLQLFKQVEENDLVLRAKPQILAEFIVGTGNWRDAEGKPAPGAVEFLTGLLTSPGHHVDAARALGALHDPAAVPALLDYLKKPRPADDEDEATAGGLGYLGRTSEGREQVHQAEEMRPTLVAAIALLRATAP